MLSCYDDKTSGDTWCAVDLAGGVEPITITRSSRGVSKFENVSKDLVYVDGCSAVDATTGECTSWTQVPLFSDANGNQTDDEGVLLGLRQQRSEGRPAALLRGADRHALVRNRTA